MFDFLLIIEVGQASQAAQAQDLCRWSAGNAHCCCHQKLLSEQELWRPCPSASVLPAVLPGAPSHLPVSPASSTGRASAKTKLRGETHTRLASLGSVVYGTLAPEIQCKARKRMELKADREMMRAKAEIVKGASVNRKLPI